MRKIAVLIMVTTLTVSCSDDNTTNSPNQEIVVTINPSRMVLDFGVSFQFTAYVEGTDNDAVTWHVNNVAGGDTINGLIDSSGNYTAPLVEPPNSDSVSIEAHLIIDPSKIGQGWAVLVDPSTIYVDMLGSDSIGVGSLHRPYRSITKALTRAYSSQRILVSAGQFDVDSGERFPLVIPSMVTLQGAGPDSTFIIGPGGFDYTDALIQVHGDAITIEGLNIQSSILYGVGIWLRPGRYTSLVNNRISNSYIGIYADGPGLPRPIIDNVRLDSDSIGIVTADTSAPIIRNSSIVQCYKYGIDIRGSSTPNLGDGDSIGAGNNTIDSCGINYDNLWLIYNGTPNTIWAKGNHWPYDIPSFNDQFIYDDEEPGSVSGPVILE